MRGVVTGALGTLDHCYHSLSWSRDSVASRILRRQCATVLLHGGFPARDVGAAAARRRRGGSSPRCADTLGARHVPPVDAR